MPLLEVKDLVKYFPLAGSRQVVRAVNGVSFTLEKGETLALVGESGSGKTTVGRCVLGLIKPTSGKIFFEGQPVDRKRNIRSRQLRGKIQLVFQEPAESLEPRMRIHEIICEPLRALGTPTAERDRKIDQVVRRVVLRQKTLNQYPAELSIGQQQRVGIARAIVTEPELIVLDEPTSALDPTARAEIIDLLIRLQKELGTAYLFISHDLNTVRYLSHRVAVMYLGMIVERGNAAEIFGNPKHPYAVGLMSSVLLPNPNLVQPSIVSLEGEIPSPIDLPKGCYLAGRCPLVDERCRSQMPPGREVGANHWVHCFNLEKLAEAVSDETIDYFAKFQEEAEKILTVPRMKR